VRRRHGAVRGGGTGRREGEAFFEGVATGKGKPEERSSMACAPREDCSNGRRDPQTARRCVADHVLPNGNLGEGKGF